MYNLKKIRMRKVEYLVSFCLFALFRRDRTTLLIYYVILFFFYLFINFNFQALCGTTVTVPTMNPETTLPLHFVNEIVTPNTVRRIQGQGLPLPKEPSRRGDLIVNFDIRFPEHLSSSARDILYDTLPN